MKLRNMKLHTAMLPIYQKLDYGFYLIQQPDYEIAKAVRESKKHIQSTKLEKKND